MFVLSDKIVYHHDLKYGLEANPEMELIGFEGKTIVITDILAVIDGENDGPSWHWVAKCDNGYYVYFRGWCDYTGWG